MSEQDPGGFEQRIRELAYLLWESSGRQYGRALEYWLAAEHEILRSVEQAESRLLGIGTASKEASKQEGGTKPAAPGAGSAADSERKEE